MVRRRAGQARVRAAKANLRNALTAEQVSFANTGRFSSAAELGSVLARLPPLADYPTTTNAMVPLSVYVEVLDGAHVQLSAVVGRKLYTILQSNKAGHPSTRYAVTGLPAGPPDPAQVTSLTW